MKKTLLLSAALIIATTGFAQGHRNSAIYNKHVSYKEINKAIVEADISSAPTKNTITAKKTNESSNALCSPVKFTGVVNAFAVGGGVTTYRQNCLTYNKDLNTVLWTSRRSADWTFPGMTSGAIQSTWLNVTTGIWDSMIIYRDSASTLGATNSHGARYPGGALFNPTGNTTIAGAYMVGSGSITGGSGWLGEWVSSRQPSGNYQGVNASLDKNLFVGNGKSPFGNVGNSVTNCGFLNMDMQQVGQSVIVSGAMWDIAAPTEVKGTILAKGAYSGGTFTWTADSSMIPGFYNSGSGGLMSDGAGARIAFDKAGVIGYALFVGRLATNYNNSADSTMMPILYKTMDGGATWTMMLAGYDWRCTHPELLKNVGMLDGTPPMHITPSYHHGNDLTVDANGMLHYVTTFINPYVDGRSVDSLQYTYTYNYDYVDYHPIVWDLTTDGTDWKTMMVDSIITSYVGSDPASDSTAAFSAWVNAATFLPYGGHLTVSRSDDGTKIFYGWGDSDPNSTGVPYNTQPDMIMKGYDVTGNTLTALTNVTNGTANCFFSFLSEVSYFDAGQSAYVVPFVYTVGRVQVSPGVYDGIQSCDFYYGNCATFTNASFSVTATVNNSQTAGCLVGIKTNTAFSSSISNYPNPFNNTTNIVVNLNENKAINVQVFDAIGNLVSVKNMNGNVGQNTIVFDASTLDAGVYYYTVTAGYQKATKKMVVQK